MRFALSGSGIRTLSSVAVGNGKPLGSRSNDFRSHALERYASPTLSACRCRSPVPPGRRRLKRIETTRNYSSLSVFFFFRFHPYFIPYPKNITKQKVNKPIKRFASLDIIIYCNYYYYYYCIRNVFVAGRECCSITPVHTRTHTRWNAFLRVDHHIRHNPSYFVIIFYSHIQHTVEFRRRRFADCCFRSPAAARRRRDPQWKRSIRTANG